MGIKLNLGCGEFHQKGYVNVDNYPDVNPDLLYDLEQTPWPWADNEVDEIILSHVLEHLGGGADTYKRIIQEIYRVLAPGALAKIAVPDPNHDHFYGDPTHVRAITHQQLMLLSRKFLAPYKGSAITPIAYMWGVDFELAKVNYSVDEGFAAFAKANNIKLDQTNLRYYRNAIKSLYVELKAIKPAGENIYDKNK